VTEVPASVALLADWSPWRPFTPTTVSTAPRSPGVYLFRSAASKQLVYVGRASERRGAGVWGRLSIYVAGRAPHSGVGNLAFERALGDVPWVRARLARVEAGEHWTVQDWARDSIVRADLEVCWSATTDGEAGKILEQSVMTALADEALWNRRR
jgi:hypothetical protein